MIQPRLDWYPQQDEDATWLSQQGPAFLLLDPRVGKTPVSLVAAKRRGVRRVVVLTKAVVREQFRREAAKWAPELDIRVESYDRISRNPAVFQALRAFQPEVLILDEGQRCKSTTARRTRLVYGSRFDTKGGLAEGVEALWVLSGTLTPNHLGETWTHLHAMGRTTLRERPFWDRYLRVWDSQWGPVVKGIREEHLEEFLSLIRPIARRRRFWEVFPRHQRPRWTVLPLALGNREQAALRVMEQALAARAVRRDLQRAKTLEERERILALAQPHTSSLRERLSEVKAPLVAEQAIDLLEGGVPKLVIFAVHTAMIDGIARHLGAFKPLILDGRTPAKVKMQRVDRFQIDPTARVFICQTETAAEGIPLHAARVMLLAELPWSLGSVIQVVNRLVSAERRDAPEILVCSLANTIDEDVARVVREKAEHVHTLNSLTERPPS